jgi:uncharacterized protein (DUF58 family)
VIVISDLFDDPAAVGRSLSHFVRRRHEVVVLRVLDPRERTFPFREPTRFASLESERSRVVDPPRLRRAYRERFAAHEAELRRTCHRLRVDLVTLSTDEPAEVGLARYLKQRLGR